MSTRRTLVSSVCPTLRELDLPLTFFPSFPEFERVRLGLSPDVPIVVRSSPHISCFLADLVLLLVSRVRPKKVQQWQNLVSLCFDRALARPSLASYRVSPPSRSPYYAFLPLRLQLAVSYPARKFGIKRLTTPESARLLCPEVVVVHVPSIKTGELEPRNHPSPSVKTYKISLDPYRRESEKIVKVFRREVPDGIVEKASIDEAFLDLTVPVRKLLLARYPYLAQPPPSSPLGLDNPLPPAPSLDWEATGWGTPPSLPPQGDTWADVALFLGAELMDRVRGEVVKELGYTTSAGLSHSKILAKVCSAFKKPYAQVSLTSQRSRTRTEEATEEPTR